MVIPNKEDDTLLKAIDTLWVTIHGPPKELITDGETGIVVSQRTTEHLARRGIKLHPRGKDQHARFVERRGALLRDTIHRVEGQLREEGIVGVPFESTLAECVFSGNALLNVGGSTPYNALYGRVPHILPSIDQVVAPGDARQGQDTLAHTHRLREISVQAMIEGSARARLGRALNTRTTMPAQKLNLSVGEEVDFYRSPTSKDASGWYGPAEVIDVSRATRGITSVKWQNRTLEIQLPNIRRHLHFLCLLTSQDDAESCYPAIHSSVWTTIKNAAETISPGNTIQVGFNRTQNGQSWTRTTSNIRHPKLFGAIQFLSLIHI